MTHYLRPRTLLVTAAVLSALTRSVYTEGDLTRSGHTDTGDTILALYDALEPGGYEQRLGYELAVEKFTNQSSSSAVGIVYHSSQVRNEPPPPPPSYNLS